MYSSNELTGRLLDIHDKRWTTFVYEHPDTLVFHLPAWPDLISECYGYRSFVAAVVDQEGKICAGVPIVDVTSPLTGHRWTSLPFTDFCAPLFSNPLALEVLLDFLIENYKTKEAPRIEIRWPIASKPDIYLSSDFVVHTLNIDSNEDEVFRKFRKNHRLDLSRQSKSQLHLNFAQSTDDFNKFYNLHLITRRRLGVPVQPKRFFDLLWDRVIDRGMGFVLLACHQDEAVAGAVFLYHNKTIIYKYGASIESYLNLHPNKHIIWRAIQWGCENGYTIFNFGNSPKKNKGLRHYKSGWGAEETDLFYSNIGVMPSSNHEGIINSVMEMIIRHSPLFVCRATGEMLYKHFG